MCSECIAALPAGVKLMAAAILIGSLVGLFVSDFFSLNTFAIIEKVQGSYLIVDAAEQL